MINKETEINIWDIIIQLKKNILPMLIVAAIAAMIGFVYSIFNVSTTYSTDVDVLVKNHITEYDINASRDLAKSLKEIIDTEEYLQKILAEAQMEDYGISCLSEAVTYELAASTSVLSVKIITDSKIACETLASAYSDVLYDAYVTHVKKGNIEILSRGKSISEYTENNVIKYTAAAFVLGVFLFVAFVFALKIFNYTIQNEAEFLRSGDMQLLGTIPTCREMNKFCDLRFIKRKTGDQCEISKVNILDFTNEDICNAYEAVLDSINLQKNTKKSRIVVFSSDDTNNAKATVAVNVAIAAAKQERKVLMIDADSFRNEMINVAGANKRSKPYNPGASKKAIAEHIIKSHMEGLDILVLGNIARYTRNVSQSDVLNDMLSEALDEYDMIFINAPHIAKAENQVLMLAEKTAGIVMVVNINQTMYSSLQYVRKKIENTEVALLGAVLADM